MEGNTEFNYIKDYVANHGMIHIDGNDLTELFRVLEHENTVIHANRIDAWYSMEAESYDVFIFICDTDDEATNAKIRDAISNSKRNDGGLIKVLSQEPFMEAFIAAHFEDFIINDDETQEQVAYNAKKFLKDLTGKSLKKLKNKMTLSWVIDLGGNIIHARRYEQRFKILSILTSSVG